MPAPLLSRTLTGERRMNKNFFDMEHGSVVDSSLAAQVVQQFAADNTEIDIFCEKLKLTISQNNTYSSVVKALKVLLADGRFVSPTLNANYVFVTGVFAGSPVLMFAHTNTAGDYDGPSEDDENVLSITIDIYSIPEVAHTIKALISDRYETEKLAKIRWWYRDGDGRAKTHDFYLPKLETKLAAEFYPDMGDPYQFMDEYLSSPASVLLLAGPPGTGKTTWLRHMISEHHLLAHVVYDEGLMQKDTLFQQFLFDKESDIIVIEDADTILSPRESDGNKMMSRFLSISDGLIKLPNKKLVFTTNLSDFNKVDPALLRPGRCHAMVHTRPLNLSEAQAACKVANLPIPIEKGEYTIAELFNQGFRPKIRQVGFGARH